MIRPEKIRLTPVRLTAAYYPRIRQASTESNRVSCVRIDRSNDQGLVVPLVRLSSFRCQVVPDAMFNDLEEMLKSRENPAAGDSILIDELELTVQVGVRSEKRLSRNDRPRQ